MNINNVFIGTRCVIKANKFDGLNYDITFEEVDMVLLYKQNNEYFDIINKEFVKLDYEHLYPGDFFVNVENYPFISFLSFVSDAEKLTKEKYKIKYNMTRRQLIKKVIEINNDIKLKDEEKKEKRKRFKLV